MAPEIIFYAIGGVCALAVALLGARGVRKQSGDLTSEADPNQKLISIVERQGRQIERLSNDSDRSKVRMSDLERDLADERSRSDRQDTQISTLQGENRDLRKQLDLLQRAVAAWETWHRWLVSKWHELRERDTPPDGPQAEAAD